MKKMQQTEVLNLTRQKLGKHPSLQSFINNHSEDVYKVGDIVVLLNTIPRLRSYKLDAQKILLRSTGPASIETVDGKRVLIGLDTTKTDVVVYHFYCVNSSNTTQVGGLVTADIKDKEKAKAVIYDIVKGIKFKVQ
ncbi:hypothetical protein GCM10022392_33210 [Mucilaginibacter panaciglaebae]|uniref:Uncharacterized protein n=2 Tax=Mucilaginibacter panaciglaebae TaxID=502331 RepID=A0ABP7X5V4_9SPHI